MNKRDIPDDLSPEQRSQVNESIAQYHRGDNKPKDFLDELSPTQLAELHKANDQYERGETIPHEQVLEELKRWKRK
jgi:predicted transcriptional regulator